MTAKLIQVTGLACVGLLTASCASGPNSVNNGYGGGYPGSGSNIDPTKTAALVAAGIAGLSLYHYAQEKDKRKEAERERDAYAYGGRRNQPYYSPQRSYPPNGRGYQHGYSNHGW